MKQISFVINTSINTLDYLKLLIESLKDNLYGNNHEILVFVDSDNEGTVDYLKSVKKYFYDLKIITHSLKPCVGYSRNNNLLVEMASHDIVSYLQCDMVISKNYDLDVLNNLEDNCVLSSTRIEPPLHGGINDITITQDFGLTPKDFKYHEFLEFADSVKNQRETTHFFAPITFHKKTWLDYGGYDTLFRRSREDSDLVQRFIHGGVKLKQTYEAVVYHFSCVTSRGLDWFNKDNNSAQSRVVLQKIADSIEVRRFFRRWGNFSHDSALQKYDCDLVISNIDDSQIIKLISIEPFFSRVWLKSPEALEKIKLQLRKEHDFANKLLDFTEDDWNIASKFYNQTDYDSIFREGSPEKYNVKVELDLNAPDGLLLSFQHLGNVIKDTDHGIYELGEFSGCTIEIVEKTKIEVPLKIQNPPFDMSLIHVQ